MKRHPQAWWDARKDEIHALYYDEKQPQAVIAQRYGVSQGCIFGHFRRWGWQSRKPCEARRNPRQEWWESRKFKMRKMYYREGMTQREIAQSLGKSQRSVSMAMRRWGWEARPGHTRPGTVLTISAEAKKRRAKLCQLRKAEAEAFWDGKRAMLTDALWRGETVREIGKRIGVTAPIVSRWLAKLGIHQVWYDERDGAVSLSRKQLRAPREVRGRDLGEGLMEEIA